MADLFGNAARKGDSYSAQDIEVLEGLEPVRKRPGMYIGGTDEGALHHLVAEVLDNSMDEAVAGFATRIELELGEDGYVTVRDNGRGIPVDNHPKYPTKSALEVILCMLHSGGKFSGKVYETSGGLHGVGISVVNALSDDLVVEVAREKQLYSFTCSKGIPQGKLKKLGPVNKRGTSTRFHPDPEIFGANARFKPERLYKMARAKAYLFAGVHIAWKCAPELLAPDSTVPAEADLHFPNGLADYLATSLAGRTTLTPTPFAGNADFPDKQGRVEWAVAWPADEEGFGSSYCNTVPTPQGGTHEAGLRLALTRSLRGYGEMINNKRAAAITADDVMGGTIALLSVFIREPQFQGQTKDRLANPEATRLVENVVKDRFDIWLTSNPTVAKGLLEKIIEKAEERARRRESEIARKTATRKLRLPGKLADCSGRGADDTELFIVEGDSAGGSAKQARNRESQAILPLKGKILNVASATADKLKANQELADLVLALGCGMGRDFDVTKLRYERVIIMTDADVDGAHIASLLLTFFYREMPDIISKGHLFLAQPPLYRLSQGSQVAYARDEAHKEELMAKQFKGRGKVDIGRFKGLGEMAPAQLKETTMDPKKRTLLKVFIPDGSRPDEADEVEYTHDLVERLMGKKPELRFQFIQENAKFAQELDV